MNPYYRGFKGTIIKDEHSNQIISKGIYSLNENKLTITELLY